MSYGCHNMPRPTAETSYVAQAGWIGSDRDAFGPINRVPHYIDIKAAFGTTACQYTQGHPADPGCSGCCHQSKEKP